MNVMGAENEGWGIRITWLEKPGGGTGRDLPLRTPLISFPGWDPGNQYITKMDPFCLSWTVFQPLQ